MITTEPRTRLGQYGGPTIPYGLTAFRGKPALVLVTIQAFFNVFDGNPELAVADINPEFELFYKDRTL